MNKNDFKNPLIQSGAVLLFVFLLISIVVGSGSQGVWESIGSLFSGLVSAIVFIIALLIAIFVSIAVMIGLFIAAVSIYSVDRGKEMWGQFITNTGALLQKVAAPCSPMSFKCASPSGSPTALTAQPEAVVSTDEFASLEAEFSGLNTKLSEQSLQLENQAATIDQLKLQVLELSQNDETEARLAEITDAQQVLETRIVDIASDLSSESDSRQQFEKQATSTFETIQDELNEVNEKTSVPDTIAGVLSYIDLPEDRDLVTEKAKEAISRGMTYSQIDDFFKASLKPEVYEELASHPRLTKDFLRSIKKKF